MITKHLTFTLTTLLFSTQLMAGNHMLLIGGGGEPQCKPNGTGANARPQCDTTIFDESLKVFGPKMKNSNWKTEVSFNGGHETTESLIATEFPSNVRNAAFTEQNYPKLIQSYIQKIKSGEIKNGDQLMVVINTHGGERQKIGSGAKVDEVSHSISVSGEELVDFNTLKGSSMVNLDAMDDLIKLASSSGIKLGIIDLSCHSGASQALKKDYKNVCVVSATGPKHFGYAGADTFGTRFIKNLTPGVSLEEAFLDARANDVEPEYPMISTNENNIIMNDVYQKITPFLYYHEIDPRFDKFASFLQVNSTDQMICKREVDFKDLISKIEMLKTAASGKKSGYNGDELVRLLKTYKAEQDELLKLTNQMRKSVIDLDAEIFPKLNALEPKAGIMTTERLISERTQTIKMSIQNYSAEMKNVKDPKEKARLKEVISIYEQLLKKRESLILSDNEDEKKKFKEDPRLFLQKSQIKEIAKRIGENRATATKIAIQEKKFYNEMYRSNQTANQDEACRKIVF